MSFLYDLKVDCLLKNFNNFNLIPKSLFNRCSICYNTINDNMWGVVMNKKAIAFIFTFLLALAKEHKIYY